MLKKESIKWLANQRLIDAQSLIENVRFHAAMYLSGYAIELALKWHICKVYEFKRGSPETPNEFKSYLDSLKDMDGVPQILKELRQIKHHDLNELLFYSGVEISLKENHFEEWSNVFANWSVDLRYNDTPVEQDIARQFVKDTQVILEQLL